MLPPPPTSPPPHLIVFPPSVSFLLPLVFLLSCLPHISPYMPLISALVSIVSFCPPHVTQPLSSLVLLFFVPSCFRILAAFVVVVRSLPRFPFGMPVSHKVLMTFSLLNIRRSVITTSTALHAFAPACALRRTPSLSLYPPSPHNTPPKYTNLSPLSQSLVAYVLYFRLPRLSFPQSLVTNSVSCSSCLPFATSTRSSA